MCLLAPGEGHGSHFNLAVFCYSGKDPCSHITKVKYAMSDIFCIYLMDDN